MNEELKAKVVEFLNSETGEAVKTLIAYAIRKTKTEQDDIVLDNIDEVAGIIAENIQDIADKHPEDKEAKESVMIILRQVVKATETKWDDRILAVVDTVI